MKLMLRSLILLLLSMEVIAGTTFSNTSSLTAIKLSPICGQYLESKSREGSFNQGLCVGIILGVEDNAHYDNKICIPKSIDFKDRVQVVMDYVATQTNRMNEAFASLVFDAMVKKWPCS